MFTLALSAGHYMGTSGKRCMRSLDCNETREWWLNNRICVQIEEQLQQYADCAVIRLDDRTGAHDVTLKTRRDIADRNHADFYLAVHHNAGIGGGTGGGVMVYVYTQPSEQSIDWQRRLYDAIINATALRGNRATPLARANLYEVREPRCAAVLLECGFMDSRTDIPIILSENFATQVATACVGVIVNKMGLIQKSSVVSNQIVLYRVAKSYEDGKYIGQLGAFAVIDNAYRLCNNNVGTYVFDESGNVIYPTLNNTKLLLDSVPLYATANTTSVSGYKTGTYYLWDEQSIHGRRRITNAESRIGVPGQVTGWIDEKYI